TFIYISIQIRVDDDDRNIPVYGRLHGRYQAAVVEGSQYDGADAPADKILDYLNLHLPVVFFLRSLPDHFYAQFLRGFFSSGMDTFPEKVGSTFGNYCNLELVCPSLSCVAACATAT